MDGPYSCMSYQCYKLKMINENAHIANVYREYKLKYKE